MNMYVNQIMFSLANGLGVAAGGGGGGGGGGAVALYGESCDTGPIQCERTLIHASFASSAT